MNNRNGPVIDMTPDGAFISRTPDRPSFSTILARLLAFGVMLGVAAIAFWAALFIIPALILTGLVGYVVLRLIGHAGPARVIIRRR